MLKHAPLIPDCVIDMSPMDVISLFLVDQVDIRFVGVQAALRELRRLPEERQLLLSEYDFPVAASELDDFFSSMKVDHKEGAERLMNAHRLKMAVARLRHFGMCHVACSGDGCG
jgi:hypothetical protein